MSGGSGILKMAQFDRPYTTFYWSDIDIDLSYYYYTVFELFDVK